MFFDLGECANDQVDALIALQSTEVQDCGLRVALDRRVRTVKTEIYTIWDHFDAFALEATLRQIVRGAVRNGHRRQLPVYRRQRFFQQPGCRCEWQRCLLKRDGSEQVMHEQRNRLLHPKRREERHLVQILYKDIGAKVPQMSRVIIGSVKIEGVASTHAMYIETIDNFPLRCTGPRRDEQCDIVSACCEPAEHFMQVYFGAA